MMMFGGAELPCCFSREPDATTSAPSSGEAGCLYTFLAEGHMFIGKGRNFRRPDGIVPHYQNAMSEYREGNTPGSKCPQLR